MFEDLDLFAPQAVPSRPLSVTELNGQVMTLLESQFREVWVAGELSSVKYATSGHVYFSLKDDDAVVETVVWRSALGKLRFRLENGQAVHIRGKLSVYVPRGRYQLVAHEIEPQGQGALELAFQQLKSKLQAKGWFDPASKKPLPAFPRRIALVTSPTGSVVRDMLRILKRRWPLAEILVCPVPVQGDEAAPRIAEMIRMLNRMKPPVDLMIVGRGGGSLEDLWAFNEENVAAAIFASQIPVVSAVGHETDVSIADFVADRRAATPSEAAEMVVPDRSDWLQQLAELRRRLPRRLRELCRTATSRLDTLARRRVFSHPLERIHTKAQSLDLLDERGHRAALSQLQKAGMKLGSMAAQLTLLNPLTILARGYSLTVDETTGLRITDAKAIKPGQAMLTHFHRGKVLSKVERIVPETIDEKRQSATDV